MEQPLDNQPTISLAPRPPLPPGDTLHARGAEVRVAPAGGKARALLGSPAPSLSLASSRRGSLGSAASGSVGGAAPRQRDVTLGQLEEAHASLCRRVGMQAYGGGEFATAVSILQDLGLIALGGGGGGGREAKRRRVLLRVPEDDITMALAEVAVLRGVIGA